MADKPTYEDFVREGERVISADDQPVGIVDQVYGQEFVLHRYGAGEVRVPFDAIQDKLPDRIKLKVRADQIDQQGWVPI